MIDQDIIGHLFEVEQAAAELLSDAQSEYNRHIEQFRKRADSIYKEAYDKIINEQENQYVQAVKLLDDKHKTAYDSYCSEIKNWQKDENAFNNLLEKLLFCK